MFLEKLELDNFRCFEALDIPLHRYLNVFVGNNGAGKTTILDALALALAPILTRLPFETEARVRPIAPGDIRLTHDDIAAPYVRVSATARNSTSGPIIWSRQRLRDGSATTKAQAPEDRPGVRQLNGYVDKIVDAHNAQTDYRLPVFAYYGTNRAVDVPHTRLRKDAPSDHFRRLAGLANALEPRTNFRRSLATFDLLEQRELRERRDKRISGNLPALDCVRRAVTGMVPGIDNPRIDGTTKRFTADITRQGNPTVRLTLDQLSDGYQVMLGVVMDFALRLATANPPVSGGADPLESEAILILDEVDLHLHPGWQQRVVLDLRRTFPNTQLVLTTHSPQVLTTVDAESIRAIRSIGGVARVDPPTLQTRGVESADVLAEVMGIDPVPKVPEAALLSEYRSMIEFGQESTAAAQAARTRLDQHFGPTHPLMLDCDRLIRFSRFKRQKPGPGA